MTVTQGEFERLNQHCHPNPLLPTQLHVVEELKAYPELEARLKKKHRVEDLSKVDTRFYHTITYLLGQERNASFSRKTDE